MFSLKQLLSILHYSLHYIGCKKNNFLFADESKRKRLRTLNTAEERQTRISLANCRVNIKSSWYIGCFGEKFSLARHTNGTGDIFVLRSDEEDKVYNIKVKMVILEGRAKWGFMLLLYLGKESPYGLTLFRPGLIGPSLTGRGRPRKPPYVTRKPLTLWSPNWHRMM